MRSFKTLLLLPLLAAAAACGDNATAPTDQDLLGTWSIEPGPGTYTYRVCETQSSVCSMEVTVTVP